MTSPGTSSPFYTLQHIADIKYANTELGCSITTSVISHLPEKTSYFIDRPCYLAELTISRPV